MPNRENNMGNNLSKKGKMVAVCSAKGGIGRTVIAANLAISLLTKSKNISILDGCFQFGDMSLALDVQPSFTISDVIEQIENIDVHSFKNYLCRHESGVNILAAPHRPEYADLVTSEGLDKVCEWMLSHSDYVLVDTIAGLPERTQYFIEKADHILLVTDLEMTSLKNTKLMLETFETLELRDKVQIIVNRANMKSVIQSSDVPQILEDPTLLYIPNDFEIVSKSLNIGIPFVMNHRRVDIAKAIFGIADLLTAGQEIALYKPKASSFAQMIFDKFKRLKERSE